METFKVNLQVKRLNSGKHQFGRLCDQRVQVASEKNGGGKLRPLKLRPSRTPQGLEVVPQRRLHASREAQHLGVIAEVSRLLDVKIPVVGYVKAGMVH